MQTNLNLAHGVAGRTVDLQICTLLSLIGAICHRKRHQRRLCPRVAGAALYLMQWP